VENYQQKRKKQEVNRSKNYGKHLFHKWKFAAGKNS
jgi:hypothetical protein